MQRLLDHPAVPLLFDRVDNAGGAARADELASLAEHIRPIPPPYLLLQCLVDSGYLACEGADVTPDATLRLAEAGVRELCEMRARGLVAPHCTIKVVVPPRMTEDEIFTFLHAVERGDVTLSRGRLARPEVGAGLVHYAASNGWHFDLFEDVGRWGYLDQVRDGERLVDFDEIQSKMPLVAAYVPSDDIARRRYDIASSTGGTPSHVGVGQESDVSRARPLDFAIDVLEGRRRFAFDGRASKTLHFLFGDETDAFVERRDFVAHFGARRPVPNRYFATIAPAIIGELMARAGLDETRSPIVFGLPPGEVSAPSFLRWSYGPKLVWLVPSPDRLTIAIRTSPERWAQPFIKAVPDEGPLRLPSLPEWEALPKAYRSFDPPRFCPRCGTASARFRDLGAALVCGACARSFETAELEGRIG